MQISLNTIWVPIEHCVKSVKIPKNEPLCACIQRSGEIKRYARAMCVFVHWKKDISICLKNTIRNDHQGGRG